MTRNNDTLDVASPYSLTDDQIAQFQRDGFIKLKGFFDAKTLEHFAPTISRLTEERNPHMHTLLSQRSTYDRAFIQVSNLWEVDEQVRQFAFNRRAARTAAQLMGIKGVRMWHDQALYKEAGGGFTPWHADQQYWPFNGNACLTIWIPLQATPLQMGPLSFARGSHMKQVGRELKISDESEQLIREGVKREGLYETCEPYEFGEVSFHYGWTLHRAGPNTMDQPRRVFTVIYMDKNMRLEPKTPTHRDDWAKWTPGTHVGRVMDDPKNPVLYDQQEDDW